MFELPFRLHWHLWKAFEHPGIHRHLRDLARHDKLSRQQWRVEQMCKLRQLLSFAGENVPYYRQVFDEVGFDPEDNKLPEGLYKLPVLTKDVLREDAARLVSSRSNHSRLLRNSTGGSTGTPVNFYQDISYRTLSTALATHTYGWWGIRPYDRVAIVWGSDRELSRQSVRDRFYRWRSRTRMVDAFRMNRAALADFITMLRQWQPRFLLGYASALEALAESMSPGDLGAHRFTAICSSAENLFPSQRSRIEQALGSPVYNFYGSREVSALAAECPEGHRLHAISNWRYLEIVDDEGLPVSPGDLGHIAITDLSNYAMPFIRYVNGDVGRIDAEPCPCGRPTPVLAEILGRSSDLIRTPSGELVHGEFFTHLFYGRRDIRQFQVHQTAIDRLILRYIPTEANAHALDTSIVRQIQERMGAGVTIEVEACQEIPVPTSGKRRFTISDLAGLPATASSK